MSTEKRKVALVTGITGQDGAYLAELLLEKGYVVHGIKRRSSSFNTSRIESIYQDPHVENQRFILHYGDMTDSTNLIRIVQEAQFVDEAVFREFYERLAKGYSDNLSEAVRRGEIAPGDAEGRAWALMGIGHFLGMHWCLWQGKMPEDQVIDDVMNMVSHGLAQAHA